MHPALKETAHRPWPVPPGRWTWRQSWCDLLFAHWPVPAAALRPLVPEALTIQTFDGSSWVGVVPFRMEGVMRRPWPDLPWISAFPELNVRLYVEKDGKPGVWFLSLDAANPVAVWAARTFFHLPYYWARMDIRPTDDGIAYASTRRRDDVRFEAHYRPSSTPYAATPGTLEHFLTERYCLYAQTKRGRLLRTEVHHAPWPLQRAEADIAQNEVLAPWGLQADGDPLLHFARRLDVIVWPPEAVEETTR
ncbi:MAG: DUF2071 domain-containing protein [Bacteroidetes bacterium]|jgi:uncharacterized protein YqjF (DUF2071 family)|nr:DUF2071 domain-containing protein [Bacteroidota bacterium]